MPGRKKYVGVSRKCAGYEIHSCFTLTKYHILVEFLLISRENISYHIFSVTDKIKLIGLFSMVRLIKFIIINFYDK